MKVYDTHSDVFSNLYERHQNNERDVFKKYHLENLKKGEVVGGIWVIYSEHDFDVYEAYKIALEEFKPYQKDYDVILGLEGLRNVKTLEELDKFYQLGIRHAMLTWNEENHLACGVAGPSDVGLKEEGKKFLDYMESHHMIVDVSHLNIKSFYDVLNYVKRPVIASHSCCYSLSDHRRNLNDEQLELLHQKGGYVGVNSARNFISKNPLHQNVSGFVDHIDYLVKHLDIDHIMLGLDMMDFLHDYEINEERKNFPNLDDLTTHAETQNIIQELIKRNYSKEDIEKIAYKNFLKMRFELL